MKVILGCVAAFVVMGNFAMHLRGEALLLSAGVTDDQWSRSCTYYYPLRVFHLELPLDQQCPTWIKPS